MSQKPLKFDPIEVPRKEGKTLRVYAANRPGGVAFGESFGDLRLVLHAASETAALIAALQVAHKAQLEAETLTFADLKPGEWFRWDNACNTRESHVVLRKVDENHVINTNNLACASDEMEATVYGNWRSVRVVRLRATFEDLP